ncbi:DUF4190 domain-containing protein [Nocardioides sp. WS12]|uniref:DUF4190 domain-containing protein n=1 Tax=Nocardioides sp. WS12 TaxID=2486272 RepID=UPI0015F7BB13|nr:DUF4190 domain-containing protein [Nocardioides sp. WS12]
MSDQPPLTPPSQPSPGFEPYQAPAYGDVAPDAPTQQAPAGSAPVPPAAPYPVAPGPYPVAPVASPYQGAPVPYQVAPQYLRHVAPTHSLATTSLALGISGLVGLMLTPVFFVTFLAVLCSPFAIWTGLKARREIRANPQAFGGEGLATAGFITGIIGLVLAVLGLVALVAVVGLFVAALSSASS